MIVKINDKEIEMHYSLRIYMLYEQIIGETLDYTKMENYTTLINLFYVSVLASMQYHKMELDLKIGDFIDWLDASGPLVITEFSNWYTEQLMIQQELVQKQNKDTKKKTKKKGESKN